MAPVKPDTENSEASSTDSTFLSVTGDAMNSNAASLWDCLS